MRSLWVCCLSVAAATTTLIAAPPDEPLPTAGVTDEHRRLLEQLDAADFATRQRAEKLLYYQAATSIPALESAALSRQTGILPPVLRVLEWTFIEGCPEVADAAERSLERLAFCEVPETAGRARAILSGNHHLRQRRAIAAIRELGGRILFEPLDGTQRGNVIWGWGGDPPFAIPGQPRVWIQVFLLRGWEGGEEGLWHLTRLEDDWSARLWGMEITTVRGSGLPIESVQALAARIPHLRVGERGASLGIRSGATGECRVLQVVSGGAAANAGLQEGDIVVQLDDIPIENFNDLVGNLLNYAPEDAVTLRIRRGGEPGQEIDIPVVLGGWDKLSISNTDRLPTPLMPPPNKRP